MASTYTLNTGIEKPATGEQSGTWGATVNTNSDILDRALNGVGTVSLSGTSSNLTTTDGSLSDGQFKLITFTGSPSGSHTVTIVPNNAQKVYYFYNISGQEVVLSQGSGSNATIPTNSAAVIYADGGGASAAVSDITAKFYTSIADLSTPLGTSAASKVVTADANGDVELSEELLAKSYNETYLAVTSSAAATSVDCEAGNMFMHTLTEATTFTFSNPPVSGIGYIMSLEIIQDASASTFAVTWPTSVDWPTATAPTISATANAVDVFVFSTRDGGTTWYGFTAGQAIA